MIGPVSSSYSNGGLPALQQQQRLTGSQNQFIQALLSEYDSKSLSQKDVQEINDAFREEGITPSRDLREAIETAGFDPADLRGQGEQGGAYRAPPPPPPRSDDEETVNAFLGILQEYEGRDLNERDLQDIQQKWQEAGYQQNAARGNFISIEV